MFGRFNYTFRQKLFEMQRYKIKVAFLTFVVFSGIVLIGGGIRSIETKTSIRRENALENVDDEASMMLPKIKMDSSANPSDTVTLDNPFKSDMPKVATDELATPAFTPPDLPTPTNAQTESDNKTEIILKGTAISGDKKIAIIQYGSDVKETEKTDKSKRSKKSTNKNDDKPAKKNKPATKMLTIGDKLEGRQVMEIGKNFIIFDDGEKLNLEEG